jgi:hypothetical protein
VNNRNGILRRVNASNRAVPLRIRCLLDPSTDPRRVPCYFRNRENATICSQKEFLRTASWSFLFQNMEHIFAIGSYFLTRHFIRLLDLHAVLCQVPCAIWGRGKMSTATHRFIRLFSGLAAAIILGGGLAGCVTTKADPAAIAQANSTLHRLDQQKVRLAIARLLEGHIFYRSIISGGAPRLGDPKISVPFEKTDFAGLPYFQYCVSASLLPFSFLPKSALITVSQQPDGQMRFTTSMNRYGGTCSTADQPFPEFEQVRNQRRKAMGVDA